MATRTIINISFPAPLTEILEREIKRRHFASKSEFFRHLFREWMAGRLAKKFEEGRHEHRAGKTKVLKSMKQVW